MGRANTIADFWGYVRRTDGCWMWTGTHGEPIPKGRMICHTCDTPLCVRPDHLYVGTARTNARDRVERDRGAYGERSGAARFTEADILAIRALAPTMTLQEVGRQYGTDPAHISRIVRGEVWERVAGPIRGPLGVGRPAKLTAGQLESLLAERAAGATQQTLAARYGISQGSVSNYLRRCPSLPPSSPA